MSETSLFSAEFRLLCRCCLWPQQPDDLARLARLLTAEIHWPDFLGLVRRHRLAGLVARVLRGQAGVPASVLHVLENQASRQARQALDLTAETLRLCQGMRDAGLDVVILKGCATGWDLYRDLGLRHSRDIDLIVPESQRDAAIVWLQAEGYHSSYAQPDSGRRKINEIRHEEEFIHHSRSVVVELHWRLAGNPVVPLALPPLAGRRALHPVSGLPGLVLSAEDQALYLLLHGAGHVWFRLKWLTDFATLARSQPLPFWQALQQRARHSGAGAALDQLLLLLDRLFDLRPLPVPKAGWRVRRLEQLALQALGVGDELTEPSETPVLHCRMQLESRCLLRLHPLSWAHELRQYFVTLSGGRQILILPLPLAFLYPLIRIPALIARLRRKTGA